MGRKNALTQNYFFDPAAVNELGTEICSAMTQMDGILEEASGVIGEISALAGNVPSEARCGALLEACAMAQNEIKSVDFLPYGQRVNNGLLNMTDHNAYISDKFIQAMRNASERAQGFGSGCRSLSALLEYVGRSVALNIKYGLHMEQAESNIPATGEESRPLTRSEFIQQMAVTKSGVQLMGGVPHVNGPAEAERAREYYRYLDEYRNASDSVIAAELAGLNHANGVPVINSGFESQKYMEAMEQLQQANSTTLGNFNYDWMQSPNVTYEFLDKVVDVSEKLEVSPDDLMAVMAFESRFDPQCVNNSSGASGLIQFTTISLDEINRTTGKHYTIEDILNMNALEQLDVVYLHCKGNGNINTLSDLYMSVLCPAAVGKDDNYCLYRIGTEAYEVNKGLDLNADGIITKAEATEKVLERRAEYE